MLRMLLNSPVHTALEEQDHVCSLNFSQSHFNCALLNLAPRQAILDVHWYDSHPSLVPLLLQQRNYLLIDHPDVHASC